MNSVKTAEYYCQEGDNESVSRSQQRDVVCYLTTAFIRETESAKFVYSFGITELHKGVFLFTNSYLQQHQGLEESK